MTFALGRDGDGRRLIESVWPQAEALAAEQPLVFGPDAPGRIVALEHEGGVRAACATLVRDFVVGTTRVRGGLIGSVATHPDWRARGLATRCLVTAEASLQREGCAFALLWAGEPESYAKRGYAPVGVEDDYLLVSELAAALPHASGVREARASDAVAIHRLYERHHARVARSAAETAALLACPGMLTLVRERPAGELQGYACLGRGRDLKDAIHEWGGSCEDVLALLRAHLERRFPAGEPGCLFLMTPPGESELGYRLTRLGAVSKRGILGMGKLLERSAAARVLAERLGNRARVDVVPGASGELVRIRGPRDEGTLDDDGLLALLFGVHAVREEVRLFLERFGLECARLPLGFFAWGLDSI